VIVGVATGEYLPWVVSATVGAAEGSVPSTLVHHSDEVDPDPAADQLYGRIGRVTVPIPTNGPGEIVVAIRGGTERFAAWCDGPVPKHASVVVVEVRSPRSVLVAPFPEADNL
jgi:hypothetical protein